LEGGELAKDYGYGGYKEDLETRDLMTARWRQNEGREEPDGEERVRKER
jgi:hypothetical protein